ncbi:putative DNA helicase B [Apostichopus japonicus]|uniref:Putative DNA helicase B n=1 Tax=Stichopus japonicus TaxID=307972 RepID=A0A2G8JJW7_STIJA|nr:putative DNA helicase B [Apostichopus japonicus]
MSSVGDDADDGKNLKMISWKWMISELLKMVPSSQSHNLSLEGKLTFMTKLPRERITIIGPFLFTDSWWEIEANINSKTKKVKDVPKYRIKKTWDIPMISQPHKVDQTGNRLSSVILDSAIYPTKKAFSILTHNFNLKPQKEKREMSNNGPNFEALSEAVEKTPWEFAFSYVLHRKYNVSGCEAKLNDLKRSGVFLKLDKVMQDNLTVYDKLKTYCRRNGHTFIHCPSKKNLTRLVQHKCKDRGKTQMFLCRDTVRAARCEPDTTHRHQKICRRSICGATGMLKRKLPNI